MKKDRKATKTDRRPRLAVLTERDLARVVGGTGGTIVVENGLPLPRGIQGTG